MTKTLHIDVDAQGVATITIDVPDKSVNVITPGFHADLTAAIERIAGDDTVRGVIVTSAKRDFMAGADLKDLVTAYDRGISAVDAARFSRELNVIYRRLGSTPRRSCSRASARRGTSSTAPSPWA